MLDNKIMEKQLVLIEEEKTPWQVTNEEKEAARRGLAASRKALQEGRQRLANLLDAA